MPVFFPVTHLPAERSASLPAGNGSEVVGSGSNATLPLTPSATGDLLVVVFFTRGGGGGSSMTTPSGWTLIGEDSRASGGSTLRVTVFLRVRQAGDPTSQVFVTNADYYIGLMHSYRTTKWFDQGSVYDLTTGGATSGVNSATPPAKNNLSGEMLQSGSAAWGANGVNVGMSGSSWSYAQQTFATSNLFLAQAAIKSATGQTSVTFTFANNSPTPSINYTFRVRDGVIESAPLLFCEA